MSPRLSIIIPTLNEADQIGAILGSLGADPDVEIILADGGSEDETCRIAERLGARVVRGRPSKADQMNLAARQAGGDLLLFLHADTLAPTGYLAEIERILTTEGVAAGAFRLGISADGLGFRLIEMGANLRSRVLSMPYGDQGLFVKSTLFQEAGGFQAIPILEDCELVCRLAESGRIVLSPLAVATSARRWKRLGLLRTTLLNWAILAGFYLGVSPQRLVKWYRKDERIAPAGDPGGHEIASQQAKTDGLTAHSGSSHIRDS